LKKKFVVIDALALAYKAYFAFISRPLVTRSGEPTSAVFGFVTQLIKIIEDTKPDYLAIAFDSKEKTFRHEIYPEYKISREKMPEDMIPQIGRIKELITLLNIPLYIMPGYEADDLIGTVLKTTASDSLLGIAVTPDKDYVQLIDENIQVIKPGKSSEELNVLDVDSVIRDYGFPPSNMIDYLALVGDKSDDIPGVAGIGEKTAVPLIKQFGSIENLYDNIDLIDKEGTKKKLLANKDNAFLSKVLATIKTDVQFDFNIESARFNSVIDNNLFIFFEQLEFRALLSRFKNILTSSGVGNIQNEVPSSSIINSINNKQVKYKLIINDEQAFELRDKLLNTKLFVFDTETDSLDIFNLRIAGVSFCFEENEAYFVALNPFGDEGDLFNQSLENRLSVKKFKKIFQAVFENPKIHKVCQNGKYDIAVLRNYGIMTKGFYFDTMLASYIIDPDNKHGMDDLAKKYLGYKTIPLLDLIESKKTPEKIFDVDVEKLSEYSSEDADITFKLFRVLKKKLEDHNLERVAYEIEFPLVEVLEDMEREGIRIDTSFLNELSKELQILIEENTKKIYSYSGEVFNINSTQQLQQILFDKLGLSKSKKTKTGYSTDARSLENLRGEHDIIEVLLNYRHVSKLKSTYTDSLPGLIKTSTGRIHTTFNQTVAATGRLSSIDPNLQNIPIRTDFGKEIRKAFIPRDKNHKLLSFDYSQIELRIMSSICSDPNMLDAFLNGEDIHRSTASKVFKVNPKDVTPDMRRKAKEVNFGILYGIGPFGLKTRLGITQTHAKEIIDTYFSTFPNVKDFMDQSVRKAQEKGFSETLTGRRRFLPNINSGNRVIRQFEERVAINMPIQGTAADMIKIAMIRVFHYLKTNAFKSKMVLQVHDELVFDAFIPEIDIITPEIIRIMENALPLNVPVKTESGIGNNWLEAH